MAFFIFVIILCYCMKNYLPSKPNGDLLIVCHMEFDLAWLKLHFGGRHTFQHCSNTFKLNKRAKYLSLSINS